MGRLTEFYCYVECPTEKFSTSWVNFNIHSLTVTAEMPKIRRDYIQGVKNFVKHGGNMPESKPRMKKSLSAEEKFLDDQDADLKKFENGEMTKDEFLNKWG